MISGYLYEPKITSKWGTIRMYKSCKTYSDQSARVAELADACISLKAQVGCSDPDARSVVLNNVRMIAQSGQMLLNLLDSWSIGDNVVREVIPQLLGLTTITPEAVKYSGDALGKTAKLAFIVLGPVEIQDSLID